LLEKLRGSLRLGPRKIVVSVPEPEVDRVELAEDKPKVKTTPKTVTKTEEPIWLVESRKLIPGESLAGYLALQPLSKLAVNPVNIQIVLALVFLVVTFVLRVFASQDPDNPNPAKTTQWDAVFISTFSYIFLVYAMGNQVFWHAPITDQQLYGQIGAAALGILGPTLHKVFNQKRSSNG